jgi:hypothetical protein
MLVAAVCDGEGLLSESESCVVVASGHALGHHEGGDPPQPVLVAQLSGEYLRLVEVSSHPRPIAK